MTVPFILRQLHHVILRVRDLEASLISFVVRNAQEPYSVRTADETVPASCPVRQVGG